MAAQEDTLTLNTNGQNISAYIDFSLTRSIERVPMSMKISITEAYPVSSELIPKEGNSFTAMLGTDQVMTGFIDTYSMSYAPGTHNVHIQARSKLEDVTDCSAVLQGSTLQGANFYQLAVQICQPFSVKVLNTSSDLGPTIPLFPVNVGETAWAILERVARYAGKIIYDDADGNFLIADVGTNQHSSGFQQGLNCITASASFSAHDRYTDYYVFWSAVDKLADLGPSNNHGYAQDLELKAQGRYRPLYIVSEQTVDSLDMGQKRAQWECNRRWGRSKSVRVTVPGWRDSKGLLWQPNYLASVNVPICKVLNQQWVISEVTYKKSKDQGSTTELELMPAEAFSILPVPLFTGNADLLNDLPSSPATSDKPQLSDPVVSPTFA